MMTKNPRSLKTDFQLLVGLGLTHRDLVGPFYEPICTKDMNPTTRIYIHIHIYYWLNE